MVDVGESSLGAHQDAYGLSRVSHVSIDNSPRSSSWPEAVSKTLDREQKKPSLIMTPFLALRSGRPSELFTRHSSGAVTGMCN